MAGQLSTELIKELREKTGAGISDIKKALEESGGDVDKATALIERKLGSLAGKRAGREARAGVIDAYIHSNGKIGAMVELFCETDFVSRNADFRELAHDLAMQLAAMDPVDEQTFLEQPFIKEQNKSVRDLINEAAGKFGENIKLGKFIRFEL
ncbi:MAG: elongation factor Ts [Candidatus Sungbacteria bacterium]|nr:elongation factor Ts [Candidatus Sungbacteria bacterium]